MQNRPNQTFLGKQQGVALPMVLGMSLVIFLIVTAILGNALSQKKLVSAQLQQTRMTLLAEAAIATEIKKLLDLKNKSSALGTWEAGNIFGRGTSVTVSNEEGRINLNKAEEPLLTAFFRELGLTSGEARNLARAFQKQRDLSKGFKVLGEVLEVRGMSQGLLSEMESDITLFSNGASVKWEYSSPEVRRVLEFLGEEEIGPKKSVLKPEEFETGAVWRITATVKNEAENTFTLEQIIRLTGVSSSPYIIHSRKQIFSK